MLFTLNGKQDSNRRHQTKIVQPFEKSLHKSKYLRFNQ